MFCEMAIWGEVVSSSNHRKDTEELPVAFFDSDLDDHCGQISHISHYWQIHVYPENGLLFAFIHNYNYAFPKCLRFGCATSYDPPGSQIIQVDTPFRLTLDLADLIHKIGLEARAPVRRTGFKIKELDFRGKTLTLASPMFEF